MSEDDFSKIANSSMPMRKMLLGHVVRDLCGGATASTVNESAEIVALIDKLRQEEGNAVTICCPNPEGSGPDNEAVEVVGEWTNWQPFRFTGRTLLHALQNAAIEMQSNKM